MALSQSDTAKFAMAVKNARPDITDEELSALVQEAGQVNDDPVKSQALAMKMLPQLNTNLADPYAGAGHTAADSMQQFSPEQLRAAYAKQQALYQQSQPSRAIGSIIAGGSGSGDVMNKNKADWEGIDKQNMLQSIDQQAALQGQATAGINAAKGVQDMSKVAGEYAGTQLEQQQKLQGNQLTLEQQKRLNLATSPETMFAKKLMASQLQSNPALRNDKDLMAALQDPNVTAQVLMGFMDKNVLDAYKKQVGIVSEETKARTDQAISQDLTGGTQPVIGSGAPQAQPQPQYQAGGGRGLHSVVGVNNVGNLTDPKTGQFRSFATPQEGRAALEADLRAKAAKGLVTVSDIITRYAPPSENNTGTYISAVAKALGVGPNDKLDMNNPAIMQKFADAIVKQEGNTKLTAAPQTQAPVGPTAPVLSTDAKERLKTSPIVGAGQTLNPNPVDVAKATGAGKEAADFNERIRSYKNYAEPQIDAALTKLDSTMAGKGTNAVARWLPANEQQELVSMLAQVNNMYPGALPAALASNVVAAQKAGGFTGSPLASLTNDQLRSALKMIKANTQREINYQQEKDKSEKTSGAGSYGSSQKTSPSPSSSKGTVEMTKDGETFDIPADKVASAEAKGYKRK